MNLLPWIIGGGATALVALAAIRFRAFPCARLAIAALLSIGASLPLAFDASATLPVLMTDAVLGIIAFADFLALPRKRWFRFERETGRIASLRKPHPVRLVLHNLSRRRYSLTVKDGVPQTLAADPDVFSVALAGRSRAQWDYTLRPQRRGAFDIECAYLQAKSPLGFWRRELRYDLPQAISVYPDLKQLGEYAVLARTNRLSLLGVRRARRIGQDHEFERLRDYNLDDNYKHLDWRATARRQKLTVRDFQSSQSQRIVFLIDCGRMMTNEANGLSLLDHSLNAALMMSYVSLRQGDSAGMILFADEIRAVVPPRGGMTQMNRLLHASFNQFPALVESRYDSAFHYLDAHFRKRALVVLMTNLIDEVNASQVRNHLSNLAGKHLPLGVFLRDHRIFEHIEAETPSGDSLWRAAAAAGILGWRRQMISDVRRSGALTLDVFPESLTAAIVNRYLEIKARHLL